MNLIQIHPLDEDFEPLAAHGQRFCSPASWVNAAGTGHAVRRSPASVTIPVTNRSNEAPASALSCPSLLRFWRQVRWDARSHLCSKFAA